MYLKTKTIWDDDRGAGGENIYEPGSEIYRNLCKWLRLVHGCRGSRKRVAGWMCSKPQERRAEHGRLFRRQARLHNAENTSSYSLIQEGQNTYSALKAPRLKPGINRENTKI